MIYIFDNDISIGHAKLLRMYDVDIRMVREEFGPHSKDEVHIPVIGARGWVLVSVDRHIQTKPPEALALRANQVTALFIARFWNKLELKEQAAWLLRRWDPN